MGFAGLSGRLLNQGMHPEFLPDPYDALGTFPSLGASLGASWAFWDVDGTSLDLKRRFS